MQKTYTNPVWTGYMADPFVLKWQDEYYAYGTGEVVKTHDGAPHKIFPLLHSRDFVTWELLGGALEPIPGTEDFPHWAPAVAERNGTFYLYYSVEGVEGRLHHLRVATANHPAGPFIDTGTVLLPDIPFTIDAHPFHDPKDDKWYLYFADEMMEGASIGTGALVVELGQDMISTVGPVIDVLRGSSSWQIHWYDINKHGRQFEHWYTIEGPCVVEHEGRYYCFYSGGAWENETYGVSYAVADHPLGPFTDDWSQHGPVVLSTVPGKVIGPGHNTIVKGPDGITDFIVYHAWDAQGTARRICIDPLIWTAEGPRCLGPTWTPQQISTLEPIK